VNGGLAAMMQIIQQLGGSSRLDTARSQSRNNLRVRMVGAYQFPGNLDIRQQDLMNHNWPLKAA